MAAVVRSLRRGGWILVPLLALVVYARSFSSFPVLEKRHSVLGDADAAAFVPLVRSFDLSTPLGDEYNTTNRTIYDVGQKHKIHHLLYGAVSHAIYRVVGIPLRLAGAEERTVLYTVNAVVGAACLVLLWMLLGAVNPHGNPRWPFVLFAGGSLSMWLYAAMPESWPFSALLVLLTLLMLAKRWLPWWGTAIWIGIAMLNNMTLAMLLVPLGMQILSDDPKPGHVVARSVVASALAFGTWLGSLWFLSIWEPDLRPDHFFAYLIWFRHFVGEPLPPLDPYNLKIVFANLFLTALVSNQSDPYVPHDALRLTFQQSVLGTVATVVVALFLGVLAWRVIRRAAAVREVGLPKLIAAEPALMAAVYFIVDFIVILLMYPGAAFLYSCAVVSLYALLAGRFLDLKRRGDLLLFVTTLVLLLVNNALQVLAFRDALSRITS